jgi:hypothetical protein
VVVGADKIRKRKQKPRNLGQIGALRPATMVLIHKMQQLV